MLEKKISEIREAWRRAGSPTNIDVKSSAYRLQAEEAVKTDDGSYKLLVAAWYDPVKDRIVMDDVLPEGGSIFITGKIASTGGGKIFASDGSADVRFNAGDHDVLTGRIDTGSSKGVVQFTDLFYNNNNGTGAKVTRWQDGKTTEYMVDHNGKAIEKETVRNGIQNYSPKDGLLYVWTEGMVSSKTERQCYEYMAKGWGLGDDKLKEAFEADKETIEKSGDLYQGATITDQLTRPNIGDGQDANFYAWMDVIDKTDTGYLVTKKKWKTGFLGCHKWTSYTITRDTTSKRMVTYTVKADKDVSVGFLKGSNTVDITSNRSIHLGNSITAQGGTIKLNAGGDIRAESAGASLNGANTINLTAKGDIGSSLRPIALKGGSGELKLGAQAANIHIDGTNLGAGRTVSSDGLLAGSTLSVAVRGDLQAAKAQGKDVTLSSVEGGVTVNDLRQLEAAGTHAVNISALNDVEVTASTGDLGLGLIESKSGDVVLTVQNGSVYDASGAADASDVSDEKRLEAWERAGLINADGSSTGDTLWQADVEAEKNRITQAYARMETYKAFKEKGGKLTDAQEQDYTALQAIYGEFASAEAAVSAMEQDENSSLGKLVASRENYGWTENDLLYSIADTIINSDGSSTTTARATNVRGKNVEINAANAGSVGEVGETVTGRLSDEDETKRLTLLKALSRADIGDFSSKDGVVSVTLKIPVTIEASGNLTVNARDNIFLESPEGSGLAVKEIVSKTGDVRVTSRGGISAAEGSGLVSGNTVTLRGGTGGIGAADAYLKIHSDPAKWAAVNAGGDIFIEAVDANGALGDMTLYSLAGDQDVSLKANNLYAYSGDKLGDDYDDFAELGYIQGQTLNFEVLGDFGTEDTALRVGTDSTVNFSESVGNVRLRGMGESGELSINGINASGVVDIDSEGGLQVGAVKGDSVELDAVKQITLTGDLESTGESKDLAVTSKEAGIELADNSTVRSKGGVKLDAKAGELKFTGGVVDASGNASLLGKSVTATQGNLRAGGRIEIGATGGGINAAGLQTQAGAGTLISAVGGGVALSGGSSIEAAEDVKISSEETLDLANATVKSTAGKVELDGLAGVVAQEATLSAADAVTVTANENVEVSNSTVEASHLTATVTGQASVEAGNSVTLDKAVLTAGALTATAKKGDLSVKDAVITAKNGEVTLTAEAADISASNATLTAEDEVKLTAKQSITAADANVTSNSLAMTTETGSVEASHLTTIVADQASIVAGDSVTLDNAELTAGALTATAKSGDLSLKTAELDISGAAELTAQDSITAADANVTSNSLAMTTETGSVEASHLTTIVADQASIVAGTSVTLDSSKLGAGALTATAKTGDLSVRNAEINATKDGITLTAEAADIDASSATLTAEDEVKLAAQNSITATDASVTSASLAMTTETGSVEASHLTTIVADQASIVAGDSVTLDNAELTAGALTATAKSGDLSLKTAELDISGAAELTAQDSITAADANVTSNSLAMTTETGSVEASHLTTIVADQASIVAGDSVTLDNAELTAGALTATATTGVLSVKDAEIKATKDGITLTAEAADIDASGVNLTAEGAAKLTAGQGLKLAPSGDAVARVTAKSLSATAGGALDASRLEVKVEEASAFRSNGLLTLTDANVSGGSLRAEGDAGVEGSRITVGVTGNGYNEGNRGDYEGVVTIKSSKGPVTLTGADVKADKGDFFARSEGDLNVETAGFEILDGGLGFKSTGGDLTLAGATGLKGDFLEMEAHGSIGMEDMELSVEEILRISAGGDINSRNLQLEITEDENGVGGKAYFEATTGTVHLEGSTITAKTSDGFIGDMTVIAGKDARLDDVFTPEKNVKAESMSIRAGDAVNFGEGTVALETKNDLTVEANHLTGDRIAAESVLTAGSALSISVKEDLHVEEGVQASGQNVMFSSKDFTLADRTTVRGGSTAEIDASGEVAFTGDVLVTADDSVGIGAASGGITFTGAVTVGDETKAENKAKVTLKAAGSILQREVSGNAGVRGSTLEAQSSGGFVKLDAREGGTSGEGGNAFTKAEIESAGDVVFGSTGRTTELAVNASKNGAVSGDLRVQGERGAVIFTNGVSASGEVAVNAVAVHGRDLSADGRLAIVTALEKNAPKGAPQGVVFSGGLSGSIVTVYAGSGDVVIEGPVRSTLGEVDVYRLDQTERGVVRVGEADSAHTLVVFNARGDVVAGPMHSADTLYAFAGWEGRVYARSGFTSDVHKAGAVEHAEPIGLVPDLSEWLNLDAAELDPTALPRLSFTARNLEYADTDRIGPWRFLLEDLTTPLGSWLFLRLRPDAAEDDQADEALLEGFPARKDGAIRDLREPTKEDFGWIMTSL